MNTSFYDITKAEISGQKINCDALPAQEQQDIITYVSEVDLDKCDPHVADMLTCGICLSAVDKYRNLMTSC